MPSKTEDHGAGNAATPSPPPGNGTSTAAATPDRSLGDSINIATRSVHTQLNKLIISRLPLALPPKADDASNYVQGLLHIAPIYIAFEAAWQDILDSASAPDAPSQPSIDAKADDISDVTSAPSTPNPASDSTPDPGHSDSSPATSISTPAPFPIASPSPSSNTIPNSNPSTHTTTTPTPTPIPTPPNTLTLLQALHLPGLQRTPALRADLTALTGWSPPTLDARLADAAADSPALAQFLARVGPGGVARRNPHTLVAYAFVLYMALFAGGRFIRASLERVDLGSGFWGPVFGEGGAEADGSSGGSCSGDGSGSVDGVPEVRMPGAFPGALGDRGRGLGGLFGGRGINGGEEDGDGDGARLQVHPLSFFRFDTPSDGEDLKIAFKERLAAATVSTSTSTASASTTDPSSSPSQNSESTPELTKEQQDDIVAEAQAIFEHMIGAVTELDEICGTEYEGASALARGRPLSLRSRDSVVVEKEKRRRLAAKVGGAAGVGNGHGHGHGHGHGNGNGNGSGNWNGSRSAIGRGAVRFG
ncbi:heme oxygenase-like protein [Hypoxylon sp. NC1633]|nr:heme oxygenase-like protein [Hypoxylon sp. NC1633]